MGRSRDQDLLLPSVLDRLLAGDQGGSRAGLVPIGLRELRAAVARDLEWLLNSRAWLPASIADYPEADRSNLTYGVPDFSTHSFKSPGDAANLAAAITEAIRRFEPRLQSRSIKVVPVVPEEVDDFQLRFRIDAVLHVDPVREPVQFDTELDYSAGGIDVKEVV